MVDVLSDDHLIDNKNETQLNRIRRLKACKHCHSLKVRCTPVDKNDPYSPCVRCINANKVCEIDSVELRKKRKRSPRQELELVCLLKEQIADLKKQLKEQSSKPSPQNGQPLSQLPSQNTHINSPLSNASDMSSPLYITRNDLEKELATLSEVDFSLKDISDHLRTFTDLRQQMLYQDKKVDVVSLNIITKEQAAHRLHLYNSVLYRQHPFVHVSPDLTVEDLMRDCPFLLNAIMAATSTICTDQTHEVVFALENQATSAVINELLVSGTKSVELIKCLIILSVWYNTPECFRLRRYHIFTNIAMIILHDLGITKKPAFEEKYKDKAELIEVEDPDPEYCVMILSLYICTVSFCFILRRSIHVKWTAYVEQCCTKLEKSGSEEYKTLAHLLRLSHELDRVYNLVHSTDAIGGKGRISKYAFSELLSGLEVLKLQIRPDDYATLAYYNSVEAFLHQPLFEDLRISSSGQNAKQSLSLQTLDAIGHCTESCLLALGEFNKLSDESIACISLIHFSRVIYTAGILLRLRYFILSSPSQVEKELVPRHAVFTILTLNKRLLEASKKYPSNYFIKKMMLILLLFINTYVTQTSDMLLKDDSMRTQLPPIPKKDYREMGILANTLLEPGQNSLQGNPQAPCLHLELLSYAATEFRKSKENQLVTTPNPIKQESNADYTTEKQTANGFPQAATPDNFAMNRHLRFPPLINAHDNFRRNSYARGPNFSAMNPKGSQYPGSLLPENTVATQYGTGESILNGYDGDIPERRNSVLHIDDEFWSNLLGTNADTFYFAQEAPVHTENVL